MTEYFERCILTDPVGERTLTRNGAAWEAQDCIFDAWESEGGSSESFMNEKSGWRSCTEPGMKNQAAIVDGILEHLFEKKGLRKWFADWKADSELKTAYDEARLWADGQPKTAQPGSA